MVSRVLAGLRNLLRRLLLRGRLRDWWVGRRGRQWEKAYVTELVRSAAKASVPAVPPKLISTSGQLGNILLIADCMWEKNDLVPELARIAPTQLLDLRPSLKGSVLGQNQATIVAESVHAFTKDSTRTAPDVILFYARPGLLSDEVFHVQIGRAHV